MHRLRENLSAPEAKDRVFREIRDSAKYHYANIIIGVVMPSLIFAVWAMLLLDAPLK